MNGERTRRPIDPRAAAEAAFKKVTTKAPEPPPKPATLPNVREQVTLRLDREVIEHFQRGGPGWQDRINDALRKLIGK
jgi:uncharacterized protein (DUF4415 family)